MRGSIRSIIAACTLAGAVGCGGTTEPGGLAGTYRLERFEGRELPALMSQTAFGSVTMVSERIVLGDNRKGYSVTTIREVNDVTPQGSNLSYSRGLGYVVRDGRIEITYACPPTADCIAGPHAVGELFGTGFALGEPASSKPASIYVRVD